MELFLTDDTLGTHLLDEETLSLLGEVVQLRKKSRRVTDVSEANHEAVKLRTLNLNNLRNVLEHLQVTQCVCVLFNI